ncbi:hypothetical protein [Streptomyces albipurpureus]|uniref:Toxin-antitoxin system, toxin component n=1 Tax=Streptomyces albipurpureus TaxID=2897419 RepID=A0ABT0UFA5_9ACTN|nr:hypothetical protein [Streptomyces sp. CWNU-1]MCM2386911.1 hypothetical protein [Streptomyces sp. CWNU-1]
MRQLRDELARALEEAGPVGPQEVFAALCARLSERRGRPVVLHLVEFPPQTASGLYLDMADRDIICVQANTHPLHQLIIFGHEVWHMVAGHSTAPATGPVGTTGTSPTGPTAAALLATDSAGMASSVQKLAARTDFRQAQESEAETFGLELGAQVRKWLERTPDKAPTSAVAQRIQASLGHRQG